MTKKETDVLDNKSHQTQVYASTQAILFFAAAIANDALRASGLHPFPFINYHLWDFAEGGGWTTVYHYTRPQTKYSAKEQILSMAIPTLALSAYEIASKSPHIFGTYDPVDIASYAAGSIVAFLSMKYLSTQEDRDKIKTFLTKPFRKKGKNLESVLTE